MKRSFEKAVKLNLCGSMLLADTETAARECNGIGADWFPAWLRWLATILFPHLDLAAKIHDMEYYYGGTEADRSAADARFLANGYLLAEHYYRWFPPLKWVAEWITRKMFRILRLFGRSAWNEKVSNAKKGGGAV